MIRILIARYTTDDLPYIMAECKKRELATRFDQHPHAVEGDWVTEGYDSLDDIRTIQAEFGCIIRVEVC